MSNLKTKEVATSAAYTKKCLDLAEALNLTWREYVMSVVVQYQSLVEASPELTTSITKLINEADSKVMSEGH